MKRVLIIDNSEIIRNLLTEYLEDYGFVVETAVNGQDGIDKALSNDYDIIFCDIHMPKKNGYQVFMEVNKEKPKLPIIMTDSLPDSLAEKAINEGAVACLTKPFHLEQLRKVIETVFTKEKIK